METVIGGKSEKMSLLVEKQIDRSNETEQQKQNDTSIEHTHAEVNPSFQCRDKKISNFEQNPLFFTPP